MIKALINYYFIRYNFHKNSRDEKPFLVLVIFRCAQIQIKLCETTEKEREEN